MLPGSTGAFPQPSTLTSSPHECQFQFYYLLIFLLLGLLHRFPKKPINAHANFHLYMIGMV
jgi:hypothetical protein